MLSRITLALTIGFSLNACTTSQYACTAENHCSVNDAGQAQCEAGYDWWSDEGEDYRCYSPSDPSSIPDNEEAKGDAGGSEDGDTVTPPTTQGVTFLGNGSHDISTVEVGVLATAMSGLNFPTDAALHPSRDELWVSNKGNTDPKNADEAMVIISMPSVPQPSIRVVTGGVNQATQHFFAAPSAISFNQVNGTFASIHDTNQVTQWDFSGNPATPTNFMGPTLWISYDFAPSPGVQFDTGHGSHLDMLHHTPLGKGIAWEKDNVYWVFDGDHDAIVRYDFQTDHGAGGSDHSDGIVIRMADGQVSDVADVPSHLAFQASTGKLFIANSGEGEIAVLDTAGIDFSANNLSALGFSSANPNYDGTIQGTTNVSSLTTLVDGSQTAVAMSRPCGIDLYNNTLIVSDNQSATLFAFDATTGALVDYLSLQGVATDIMGVAVDAQNATLYVVDSAGNQVLRLKAK